jgi:hypothetical protein
MSSEESGEAPAGMDIVLPNSTRAEMVLETVSTVTGIVPVLGGPVSNILTGMRGIEDLIGMRQVVLDLAEDIRDVSDSQQASSSVRISRIFLLRHFNVSRANEVSLSVGRTDAYSAPRYLIQANPGTTSNSASCESLRNYNRITCGC